MMELIITVLALTAVFSAAVLYISHTPAQQPVTERQPARVQTRRQRWEV